MKTLVIIVGVIVIIFIVAQIFIHRSSAKVKTYPFTVEKKWKGLK